MKKISNLSFLTLACIFVFSCKKSSGPGNTGGSSHQLVRMQQGFGAGDTVFLMQYDAQKRLISVTDSTFQDTLVATYNGSNQIICIRARQGSGNDSITYSYNASGQPVEADYYWAGDNGKYIYEFTGGLLSKKSFYSDQSGPLALAYYCTYTFSGGNITDVKVYSPTDQFQEEAKLTYGSQPNTFKTLALFNWADVNLLGMATIVNDESYFCANLQAGITVYDNTHSLAATGVVATARDGSSDPISIVQSEKDSGGNPFFTFSWTFSYN